MITTTLTPSCHWKTLVPFWLRKNRPEKSSFKTSRELSQNRIKKQIMPPKTTVKWFFNDI